MSGWCLPFRQQVPELDDGSWSRALSSDKNTCGLLAPGSEAGTSRPRAQIQQDHFRLHRKRSALENGPSLGRPQASPSVVTPQPTWSSLTRSPRAPRRRGVAAAQCQSPAHTLGAFCSPPTCRDYGGPQRAPRQKPHPRGAHGRAHGLSGHTLRDQPINILLLNALIFDLKFSSKYSPAGV